MTECPTCKGSGTLPERQEAEPAMVNAIPITAKMSPKEKIQTNVGMVDASDWCASEVARMTSKQAKVRVETRNGKVWIARAGSEVSTDFDDGEEENGQKPQ